MLVACEDGASFLYEKGHVKKKSMGEDLVTAAVLHRGLISGYPAPRRSVCREKRLTRQRLVGGYCRLFLLFLDCGFPDTPPEEPAVHLIVRRPKVRRALMVDPIRRKILKAGAVATVMAAAPRAFAQQTGQGGPAMSFYEKGPVRIRYQEAGSGFPFVAHRGWGTKLGDLRLDHRSFPAGPGIQGRVPLHRVGPAQREYRPVLRPARTGPAVVFICR